MDIDIKVLCIQGIYGTKIAIINQKGVVRNSVFPGGINR
jgi:hypothetical protein